MANEAYNPQPPPPGEAKPSSSLEELSRKVRLALLSGADFSADERTRGIDPYNTARHRLAGIGGRRR
jgi:hypothetical protein